jgi:hypothetical protein
MGMATEALAGSASRRQAMLLLALAAFAVILFSRAPIPQDAAYHHMADTRPAFGVANAFNVVSNAPFAVVGIFGLFGALGRPAGERPDDEARLLGPHLALFGGTALTAVGSAYYHLAPDNARLVWDRLPMACVCAGLVIVVLAECVSARAARRLFWPVLACAVGSVGYWRWSELRGAGDLRPYVLVQYGSLLAIALMLVLFRGRLRGERYLIAGLLAYGVAKGFEMADTLVFAITRHAVSGHTMKHLIAAAGLACIAARANRGSRDDAAV